MQTYLKQESITIRRQIYVGNKSTFSDLETVTAYVRPLTEEESSINGLQFGQGLFVMVEDTADVQEGDKILFRTIEHTVQGVALHDRGISVPHFKQVLMTKPLTA